MYPQICLVDLEEDRSEQCGSLQFIFQISDALWDTQRKQGLDIESCDVAVLQVIQELLHNSDSSYFIDGNQYADIALLFLQVMAQNPLWHTRNLRDRGGDIATTMSKIFPPLLSHASIRLDLFDRVKNTQLYTSYEDIQFKSITDAMVVYIAV
ncbi:hypothetical protein GALMADRAFT_210117 [Galerina marginata CBS 339.88]|uniref:Uncharacterized protein n=1 Tax=Galerina marginata (strain CBS 339.88) TaxID=685588 RepID=A0A067T168_GALM3|nr:hypothetical protein GALMADRAFT_210117 [Galerina marginata CBS 339.88]